MISAINSITEGVGITAPAMVIEKLLFSEICLRKLRWNEKVFEYIARSWQKYIRSLGRLK